MANEYGSRATWHWTAIAGVILLLSIGCLPVDRPRTEYGLVIHSVMYPSSPEGLDWAAMRKYNRERDDAGYLRARYNPRDDELGGDAELLQRGIEELTKALRNSQASGHPIAEKPFDFVELVINSRDRERNRPMYVAQAIFSVKELLELEQSPSIPQLNERPFVRLGIGFDDWDVSFIQKHDREVRHKSESR